MSRNVTEMKQESRAKEKNGEAKEKKKMVGVKSNNVLNKIWQQSRHKVNFLCITVNALNRIASFSRRSLSLCQMKNWKLIKFLRRRLRGIRWMRAHTVADHGHWIRKSCKNREKKKMRENSCDDEGEIKFDKRWAKMGARVKSKQQQKKKKTWFRNFFASISSRVSRLRNVLML